MRCASMIQVDLIAPEPSLKHEGLSMMRSFLSMSLIVGSLLGCSTARLPEVPLTHPANVEAPQAGAAAPSGLLEHHHAMPGPVEGRKLNRGGDASGSMSGMGKGDLMGSPEDEAAATYTCTMHPEVSAAHPGYCPRCGMTLIPVKPENGGMEGMDHGHQTSR
ncbi:hypothetical protein KQH29_00235 [bacterium]|nr:hypothetical protein [bacterium]